MAPRLACSLMTDEEPALGISFKWLQGLRKVLDSMGSYADTRVLKHTAVEIAAGSAADSTFSSELVSITPVVLSLRQASSPVHTC